MTQRLPIPGSDDGRWGDILNAYLGVSHNADGTLLNSAVVQAGAVTSVNSVTPNNGSLTLNPSDIGVTANINYRGAWATSTAYATNDAVNNNGALYVCSTSHTSGSSFDSAKWTQLSPQTGVYAQLASAPHGPVLSNMATSGTEALGAGAAVSDSSGTATAVGTSALNANTTGGYNTAIGNNALAANTTGHNNSAVGGYALYANTSGYANNAMGYDALGANTTGNSNFAGGNFSLSSNTTGYANVAIGHDSLQANTAGWYNTVYGVQAMYNNTTGIANAGFGFDSLFYNSTGQYNAALGNQALYENTSGSYNAGLGYNAGHYASGTGSTFLGAESGPANGNNPNYAISIGYNSTSNSSGSVAIGSDHTGAGAITNTQDVIQLGTALHTTQTTALSLTAAQTSLAGTTSGTAVSSQPFTGSSYKKFIVYLNGYENSTATAQTITFPVAFTKTPYLAHDDSGGSTASATALSLPISMGTPKTGWIVAEGF